MLVSEGLLLGLPELDPPLDRPDDLGGYLLVAVVDDLDQEVLALLDGSVVVEHDLEHVADDRLVVDGQVDLEGIEAPDVGPYQGQHSLLPDRGHQQVHDQHLVLLLHQHLLQDELVVLHDRIHVQLHVQLLQPLVLLEPHRRQVVADVQLHQPADQLLNLLLVQDVAQATAHLKLFKLCLIYITSE